MPINSFERRGILLSGRVHSDRFNYASHPCAIHLSGDNFLIVYSMRDDRKRSHLFSCTATISDGHISLSSEPRLGLSPGETGCFDSDGLLACCGVKLTDSLAYFYYTGWNNLAGGVWLCDSGLATIDLRSYEFNRKFAGPVMSRGIANPLFAAATSVLKEGQRFRSWYNSGIKWYTLGEEQRVRYGIHYAESSDGINWTYSPGLRIPFSDHQEHSFGRPSVIVENGVYHMWFSSRGAAGESNYRIGYAYSSDGIEWTREDSRFRFDRPSKDEEFDSLAQAYPSVFSHGGLYYMLYSGNAYGLTGSGYAVCEAVA